MAFNIIELLICTIIILTLLYYYLTITYNFWKSRNIIGPKPIPVFGNIKDVIFSKCSLGSYLKTVYNEYPNEKMIGIYAGNKPVMILNDMDLIKQILIKDFASFMSRSFEVFDKQDPLSAHLFILEPKRWRPLRTKLTPIFTSGKLREMFYLLIQCSDQLDNYLDGVDGKSVDIRDISLKFMTDTIGVCAFGLQANALADENSTFRMMGKRILSTNWKNIIKLTLRLYAPFLFHYIGNFFVDHELTKFFQNLTRDTMKYRRENNINKRDFIDLMMALHDNPSQLNDIEWTNDFMAAQLFVFFLAGFETSSSTTSNCLFELALNHNVRDKLREEITEELSKTNGKITYEGIKNMEYLDKVINETLRKYPPIMVIMRKSTLPYTFPGTEVSIPIGTDVWIPIFAIQRDPKYFPNPDAFEPERFSEEAKKNRPAMTFLSFGEGPRNCIGARFGRMQTKVALVKILQNYTVDVCDKTDKNYAINPKTFLLSPKNGLYITIKKKH